MASTASINPEDQSLPPVTASKPKRAKRERAKAACSTCQRRKVKCERQDGTQSCRRCRTKGYDCIFHKAGATSRPTSKKKPVYTQQQLLALQYDQQAFVELFQSYGYEDENYLSPDDNPFRPDGWLMIDEYGNRAVQQGMMISSIATI